MASRALTAGVAVPMIAVGGLMALLWAPLEGAMRPQVELVGGVIGILGVIFFVSGLFYSREPALH